MKKLLFIGLFVMAAAGLSAQQFGIGIDAYVISDNASYELVNNDPSTTEDTEVGLGATVIIPIGEGTEIDPYVLFYNFIEKDADSVTTTIQDDFSQSYVEAGVGLKQTVISGGPVSLLIGGTAYFLSWGAPKDYVGVYSNVQAGLSVPLTLQIELSKLFKLRISQKIAELYYRSYSSTPTSTGFTTATNRFYLNSVIEGLSPNFGIYLTF